MRKPSWVLGLVCVSIALGTQAQAEDSAQIPAPELVAKRKHVREGRLSRYDKRKKGKKLSDKKSRKTLRAKRRPTATQTDDSGF